MMTWLVVAESCTSYGRAVGQAWPSRGPGRLNSALVPLADTDWPRLAATPLWFNRGMGPKIQRFISAVISP